MILPVATISNNQTIPHGALPSRIQDPHRLLEHHRACSAQFTKPVVYSHPLALQRSLYQMHRQWVLCIQIMSLAKRLIFCLVRCISCFDPFLFTLQQHCLLLQRVAVWTLLATRSYTWQLQFAILASVETLVLFKWVLLITQQTDHSHQTSATRPSFFSYTWEYCHDVNDLYLLKALRAVHRVQEQESVHF